MAEFIARQFAASMDNFVASVRAERAAIMDERARLSRELHDGALQALSAMAIQLESLEPLWDGAPSSVADRIAGLQRMLVEEQRELRLMIRELRSRPVDADLADGGLPASLERLAERIRNTWNIDISLVADPLISAEDSRLRRELQLLVQEALINAARHGEASRVAVQVSHRQDEILVRVADNGRGFPFHGEFSHEALDAARLGPVVLKERVAALGGRLAIVSNPGGAQLEILVPYTATPRS
jgi:signal transduction histidine kinase